jgi:hypothetical protein
LRVIVGLFVGMVALTAVSVQAAPIATKSLQVELGAAPGVELVRQGCGWGWHRTRWWDRWGNWHWGRCVPNW